MTATPECWHKGSRYWKFGMYVVLLSVAMSLYFDTASPFMAVAPVFLTGAAGMNVTERLRPAIDERVSDAES